MEKHAAFKAVVDEMYEMIQKKGEAYDNPGETYSNLRVGRDWGLPPYVMALVRVGDKLQRLKAYVRDGDQYYEKPDEDMLDAANYLILAALLFREDRAVAGECRMFFTAPAGNGLYCNDARCHGGACSHTDEFGKRIVEDTEVVGDK